MLMLLMSFLYGFSPADTVVAEAAFIARHSPKLISLCHAGQLSLAYDSCHC